MHMFTFDNLDLACDEYRYWSRRKGFKVSMRQVDDRHFVLVRWD